MANGWIVWFPKAEVNAKSLSQLSSSPVAILGASCGASLARVQ